MLRHALKARRVLAQELYDEAVKADNQEHAQQLQKVLDKFDEYIAASSRTISKEKEQEIHSWLGW